MTSEINIKANATSNDEIKITKLSEYIEYAEKYMEEKSTAENKTNYESKLSNSILLFESFNKFVLALSNSIKYPFSRQVYGFTSNVKFQTPMAMILPGIFKNIFSQTSNIDLITSEYFISLFLKELPLELKDSFLQDPEYKASTTNSDEIKKLVDNFKYYELLKYKS